jgi:hypothetical protein
MTARTNKRLSYTARMVLIYGEPHAIIPAPLPRIAARRGQRARFAAAHRRRLARAQELQSVAAQIHNYAKGSPSC